MVLTLALCLGAAAAHAAEPQRIQVFTLSSIPVYAPAGAQVYQLDRLAQIEETLSKDLPGDPERAAAIAEQRIRDGGVQLQNAVLAAGMGVGLALQYGIDRVPATVIDQRYVDFGETRTAVSLERWRRRIAQDGQERTRP